jgi:hypothetical protein
VVAVVGVAEAVEEGLILESEPTNHKKRKSHRDPHLTEKEKNAGTL